MSTQSVALKPAVQDAGGTAFGVILAISFCHLLNDMMQSLLPAIYPNLKSGLHLTFGQIGVITLAYQLTASILQPLVGLYAAVQLWLSNSGWLRRFWFEYAVIMAGALALGLVVSRSAGFAAAPNPSLPQDMNRNYNWPR